MMIFCAITTILQAKNAADQSQTKLKFFDNYAQGAYTSMKASFWELPPFERLRHEYLDDQGFARLQAELMNNPEAGDVIQGTGGLRKLRFGDESRGKGKRGGLRIIYYWRLSQDQFWLFSIYDKDEASDLSPKQRSSLKALLEQQIQARSGKK